MLESLISPSAASHGRSVSTAQGEHRERCEAVDSLRVLPAPAGAGR